MTAPAVQPPPAPRPVPPPAALCRCPLPAARPRRTLRVGHADVDVLTRDEALAALDALVAAGAGGAVFTPNVDHVVMLEDDAAFRAAYAGARLCLADGMPLLWAARLLGTRLPEKLSGSDMLLPIAALAARRGWRVYLLGGAPGAAAEAGRILARAHGVRVVGCDDARIAAGRDPAPDAALDAPVLDRIRAARPDLLLVALGAPKQELFIARALPRLDGVVAIGVGASLDFLAGRIRRAPGWMSRAGLEWLFRLGQEPRRLWRRYLIQDPRFVGVVLRGWRAGRRGVAIRPAGSSPS